MGGGEEKMWVVVRRGCGGGEDVGGGEERMWVGVRRGCGWW